MMGCFGLYASLKDYCTILVDKQSRTLVLFRDKCTMKHLILKNGTVDKVRHNSHDAILINFDHRKWNLDL
jgi:hypothetical protein